VTEEWLSGEEGRNTLGGILASHEPSLDLASRVIDFYGDVQIALTPGRGESSYRVDNLRNPFRFNGAKIWLDTGSNRVQEALCHELLHLENYMLGLPSPDKISVPDEIDHRAEEIQETMQKFGNLMQHEFMFQRFLDLGYEQERFLTPPKPAPDYKALAQNDRAYIPEGGFPWWCLEYIRHWCVLRQLSVKGKKRAMRQARKWARHYHGDITNAFDLIRALVESGAFLRTDTYAKAFNDLLVTAQVGGQVTGWVLLEPGPVVIGMDGYDGTKTSENTEYRKT